MANQLDQLKEFSTISCDTADSSLIKKFGARDATTNPSLVLRVAQDERYTELLNEAVYWELNRMGMKFKLYSSFKIRFWRILAQRF